MGLTYITGAITNFAPGPATSTATGSTLNLAANDIVVAWYTWDGATGGTLGCSDSGSNTFTTLAEINNSTATGFLSVLLAATANASATITATTSNSRGYRSLAVMQFRPDSGDTVALDGSQSTGTGTGTSHASGSLSTTEADALVIGVSVQYNYGNYSAHAIGGTAADYALTQPLNNQLSSMWTRILTATASSISATATSTASVAWAAAIVAIKSSAGSATALPVFLNLQRQFRN